jgi:general secretion pathway protein B
MSFILDALKKSESERKRADAPALYETQMAPARPRVATWLIVLGALLLINIVVLSVVLLRGTREAAPAAAAVSPTPAPAASAPASPAPSAPAQLTTAAPAAGPAADTATADNATGAAAPPDDDAPAVDPAHAVANPAEVPSYEQLASAPGANLPELKLDLHAYAANPADRFVFLSGVNLKEGQTSPAGVRVESITPDGAILSWHGTRFFLHSQ